MAYEDPERRKYHEIPDELVDHIIDRAAEKAAEKVFNKVYQDVGRGVIKKASWVIGIILVSAAIWLGGRGYLR